MFEWLAEQFGEQPALIIYYFIIFVGLIIAVFVLRRLWKTISGGTFVHGAKNERRLAVVDATAVDNRRRLVLVRRDNVEHLVMIGGMSDVLIESNIGESKQARRYPDEKAKEVHSQKRDRTEPIAAAPIIAAAQNTPSKPPLAKRSEPEVDTVVASVPNESHETAPTIEPPTSQPTTKPATAPTPPAPIVKEPQNVEPTIEIAADETFSEHDFDLDISADDLTTGNEESALPINTFEPTVDFPSDHDEKNNSDQNRKPLEDEMEALLTKLTSTDK